MTIIEFFAATKPISQTDRILMLGDLRGLSCSPLFDRPAAPDDRLRRDAFDRAGILLRGMHLLDGKLAWRYAGPTIITPDHDAQPLYTPRGGR
jgi:hypothetical protein